MPDLATFGLFLTASFILSITPGPGILYILARSLHGGKAEGVLSGLGLFVGGLFHVFAATIGISSLLMTSAVAFTIVKYVGATYLIYLGLRTLLSRDTISPSNRSILEPKRRKSAFYQGIITEILNPKTALFFLAFIPQFINVANGNIFTQFLVLGLITNSLNFVAGFVVATFAGAIGQKLQTSYRFRQGQRITSGFTLIGLGAYVAVAEQK
ncbi:putative threonine efflux protein [Hyella patelloides LEGE 07179]|uniref:Putative threonine efflux protein n=1 Tax=Hyella patelloides LEGE 07179 TaxID=945734 RepID=A0A563VWS0_9CYAN|nr:LysE family translocator [Hyella patelloides]VEP15861.1 putative threonine efflux protein [Hyella patelloides LEGE 07179]